MCTGRDLWVLALAASAPDRHVLLRPEVKYVGNIHGNEVCADVCIIMYRMFDKCIQPTMDYWFAIKRLLIDM